MELLSDSDLIISSYGYCGCSVMAENMPHEVSPRIIQDWTGYDNEYSGFMLQSELDRIQDPVGDVVPLNNMTVEEKLDTVIVMAESIAEIHGYIGGVIVHGDVHPYQWMMNGQGRIKLNDFSKSTSTNDDDDTHDIFSNVSPIWLVLFVSLSLSLSYLSYLSISPYLCIR